MKKIPIFDLDKQYANLKNEIDPVVLRVFETSAYINGADCDLFEKNFAKYCETDYALGIASGTSALSLSIEALGVSEGDEVICPSHTFAATAEAIVHNKAIPVFVDIEESTYNIDPAKVEKAITNRTKAIIVVHLYGQPANMDAIMKIAKRYKLKVIEDAAQAHGATYKGKKVGSIGDIACFSFFPAKNLGCAGDGGGVTTNNKKIYEKVKSLKDHGRVSKYVHKEIGYGERLDNLQAAILNVKLPHLDEWNRRRNEIASIYTSKLHPNFKPPQVSPNAVSSFYVYTIRHQDRDRIIEELQKQGISAGIYYPLPLHKQVAFRVYKKGRLPVTEKIAKEIFSIPVYPELDNAQIQHIIDTLNGIIAQ
ncbi:DegT/DnrJ/EryC1/StrS family aminotransferase [Candidatus Woesebacteria bacterium]|nr:DegT/DnrJ/EryC1/StrS family aminotransferase [Candidatus Woesebacteria bacterium]